MEPVLGRPPLLLLGWSELLIVIVPTLIVIVGIVVIVANATSKAKD